MKIKCQFPTRGRRKQCFEILRLYRSLAEDPDNMFFHISCNTGDTEMDSDSIRRKLDSFPNVSYSFANMQTKIEACNHKAAEGDWDIIVLVSDDMIPRVKGWDNVIRKDMQTHFPDTDGALWYNDGHRGADLCTLSIMGRRYFDRFGYLYYPEYKSLFCDDEYTLIARRLGKIVYSNQCIIEHCHPDFGLRPKDKLYNLNGRYGPSDERLFQERRKRNFDM